MDDREIIRKIMEEVKDEKLREELLSLVAEKNKKQSEIKQGEEPINHKARQGILFKAGSGIMSVISVFVILILIILSFIVVGPLYTFAFIAVLLLVRIVKLLSALAEEKRKK
jgi:hypothetical protein